MSDTKIKIIFKSGHIEIFKCEEFAIGKTGCKVTSANWSPTIQPRIMQIDLDEIACVLEIK